MRFHDKSNSLKPDPDYHLNKKENVNDHMELCLSFLLDIFCSLALGIHLEQNLITGLSLSQNKPNHTFFQCPCLLLLASYVNP